MSSGQRKPRVGILMESQRSEDLAALTEWLVAAGFQPVADIPALAAAEVVLIRWPAELPRQVLALPHILLVDRDALVPPTVAAHAAGVLVAPNPADMKSLLDWSSQLLALLRQLTAAAPLSCAVPALSLDPVELARPAPQLVAIAVSTGGPLALPVVLSGLRGKNLPPILVVQHMPANFLPAFVDRLAKESGLSVTLATAGECLQPGRVYFAPGDSHLIVRRAGEQLVAGLTEEPPRRGHRPAAEVLFESCARLPIRGIGVMMTGMGQDGAEGLLQLRRQGWATLGQNAATCAIYGMPKAASQLGALEREVALEAIGPWLVRLCRLPVGR